MTSKQPKMILSMQLSEVQCGDFMLTQKLPVCSYSRNRSLFLRIYQIVRYLGMTRNENVTTTWPREQGHIPWTKGHRDFKFETSWRKVRNAATRKNRLSIWNRVGSSKENHLRGGTLPPRCGRGLNSIQCIGVISNNTKYRKYIKSRCTLQPYSWQGFSWGFLVLITPAIEIKLDLTSNLIVKRYMISSRSLLFFAGCFYLSSFTKYCRFSTKIYILVHTDLF